MILPSVEISYDKARIDLLGAKLKDYFRQNHNELIEYKINWIFQEKLIDYLSISDMEVLIKLNLIDSNNVGYFWNFQPNYAKKLLLFSDYAKYNQQLQYVWLSTDINGNSWKFTNTLVFKKGINILDLGTGSGLLALIAGSKGCKVTGIDINPRAINLATLNRDLNGLNSINFQVNDWNKIENHDYDLIISQPPFAPYFKDTPKTYAFSGGDITGINAIKLIITRFVPRKNQKLAMYVHILENDSCTRFNKLLNEWIDLDTINVSIQEQRKWTIERWWDHFRKSKKVNPTSKLPNDIKHYSSVVAYFLYLDKS